MSLTFTIPAGSGLYTPPGRYEMDYSKGCHISLQRFGDLGHYMLSESQLEPYADDPEAFAAHCAARRVEDRKAEAFERLRVLLEASGKDSSYFDYAPMSQEMFERFAQYLDVVREIAEGVLEEQRGHVTN